MNVSLFLHHTHEAKLCLQGWCFKNRHLLIAKHICKLKWIEVSDLHSRTLAQISLRPDVLWNSLWKLHDKGHWIFQSLLVLSVKSASDLCHSAFYLGSWKIISWTWRLAKHLIIWWWRFSTLEIFVPFVDHCFTQRLNALSFAQHTMGLCSCITQFNQKFHTNSVLLWTECHLSCLELTARWLRQQIQCSVMNISWLHL
jgi:hypothetical protein